MRVSCFLTRADFKYATFKNDKCTDLNSHCIRNDPQ